MDFAERVNRAAAVIAPEAYKQIVGGPPPEKYKMALVGGQIGYDDALQIFSAAQRCAAAILAAACPDLIFKPPESDAA